MSKGLPPLIAHSWKECRQKGIDPWHRKNLPVDLAHLNRIRQKNRLLLQVAEPIMQSVHEIVRESHSLLALMDSTGCVLRTIGDDTILQHSENIFSIPVLFGEMTVLVRMDRGLPWNMIGPYSLSVPSIIALTSITGAVQLRYPWQWRTSDRRAGPFRQCRCSSSSYLSLGGSLRL